MRILMVEDEKRMAEAIAQVLKKNNYSVDLIYNGEDGLDFALSGIYDIIILDIMLPKLDGIAVLKSIRKNNIEAPVILLTAKGETQDKVYGLDCGADDYLPKPFPIEELLARLRALGRRKNQLLNNNGTLKFGNIELNQADLTLSCEKSQFKLTLKEYQLLEMLIQGHNTILSKELIIEKLWGYDTETEDNHVEVYISFLRKKLLNIKSNAYIQTIRGAGYILKLLKEEK